MPSTFNRASSSLSVSTRGGAGFSLLWELREGSGLAGASDGAGGGGGGLWQPQMNLNLRFRGFHTL